MNGRKLTRTDLFSMAIGQIIGVGIMTMTGIAIGFTGRSVNIAYILAGILTVISAIPQIYIGGTANFIGGQYSQIAVLGNKTLAGIFIYIQIAITLALSMYTLSFSEYFLSLFPGANAKVVCFIVLTTLLLMHMVGMKQAARLQRARSWPFSTACRAQYLRACPGEVHYWHVDLSFEAGKRGWVAS